MMTSAGTDRGVPARVTLMLNPQTPDEQAAVDQILRCDTRTLSSLLTMIDRDRDRPIVFVAPDA